MEIGMINEAELMSELSPDLREFHLDLRVLEEKIADPRVRAAANKHRRSLLLMHGTMNTPDDAPVWGESAALEELVETPCGSDDVFFEKAEYLTLYISVLDPDVEEIHAVTDSVHAYLSEREAA
jgi:hypothetical protein